MNLKKEISSAVILLAASIIFLSSAALANNVFAQTEGEEESISTSASTNYENFQNCLSDASSQYSAPTGDQIVNCFVESGYVQGSSSTGNVPNNENESENTQVSVVGDENEDDQTENVQVSVVGDKDDHQDDHQDEDEDHQDEDEEDHQDDHQDEDED
jgi:cytoskeletal protein RodZ